MTSTTSPPRRPPWGRSPTSPSRPPAPISSATYDPLTDRLLTWNGAGGYQHDLNGNLTSDGTNTYEWSKRNLLKDIKQGMTTTAVFTYDGVGRRKSKTVGSATTQF